MSLSLMTLMGYQKPTKDEKYVIKEAIKILRFFKHPIRDGYPLSTIEKTQNEIPNHIIGELKKTLDKEVRK